MGIVSFPIFDTARVYQYLQKTETPNKVVNCMSLEKLVKLAIGVDLDKLFQVADWRIRPLPLGMLNYARSDSHYLIPLYIWLSQQLDKHGPTVSDQMKSLAISKQFVKNTHKRLKIKLI